MEQFYKLERQTKMQAYLQCSMQEYSCLQELAQLGHIPAMMLLAKSKDADISARYYMMASDAGEHQAAVKAFWRFINRHQQNSMPDAFDIKKVGERLRKGAEDGDADCMFALAMCYAKDFVGTYGTQYNYHPAKSPFSPNQEKMIFWLKKSFEQGCKYPGVQVLMAEYYATGKIWNDFHFEKEPVYVSLEKCIDPKKAFAILEPIYQKLNMNFSYSPERNHWYQAAKYLITMFYFDGFGTEPDSEKARACIHAGGEGDVLTVTSKEKDTLTAIRKELEEALHISNEKRLEDLFNVKYDES